MFDRVRCLYPLPHHQEADFQTKDLAHLIEGESVGGDVHGDIRISTSEGAPGEPGHRWIEFHVRFTSGRVEHVRDASG